MPGELSSLFHRASGRLSEDHAKEIRIKFKLGETPRFRPEMENARKAAGKHRRKHEERGRGHAPYSYNFQR
jgi:hypothetical protein